MSRLVVQQDAEATADSPRRVYESAYRVSSVLHRWLWLDRSANRVLAAAGLPRPFRTGASLCCGRRARGDVLVAVG